MGKSHIKRGILLSYISTAIEFVVALVYTPILIRTLGKSEYGTYNYVVSVISYLTVFSSGFSSAYLRQYSHAKANNKSIEEVNGKFVVIYGIISILMLVIGSFVGLNSKTFFGGKATDKELETIGILVWIVLINLVLTCIGCIFDGFIMANERFIIQKSLIIVRNLIRPILILVLVYNNPSSISLAIGTSIINVALILANSIVCLWKLKMKFSFNGIRYKELTPIFKFTSFVMLSVAVDKINWSVDSFILGKAVGSSSIAIYSVGSTLNTHYQILGETISNVFIPRVHKHVADNAPISVISDLFIRIGRIQYMLLLLICSGFILFGQSFLALWVGKGYELSYYIAIMLMIPVTIPEIQKIGIEIQRAMNLHKFRSIVYALIAVANIIMSLFLVKKYEALGCAIGTAISLVVGNGFIMNYYYYKKIRLNIKKFFAEILKITLSLAPTFIFGILLKMCFDESKWMSFGILVFAYSVIFSLNLYFVGMNTGEKDTVKSILKRMRRKRYIT